jgi:AcrR family transcriptional regulator/DNA-binding MarR family transcriptional regulator
MAANAPDARLRVRNPVPGPRSGAQGLDLVGRPDERSGALAGFRLTVRRYAVLSAVAELCAQGLEPCNREVCGRVGIADQSQVSRLMMGLQARGLVENTRAGVLGTRKAWRVTPRGQAVLDANRGGRVSIKKEDRRTRKGASGNGASVNGASVTGGSVDGASANGASANGHTPTAGSAGEPGRRGVGGPVSERQYGRLLEATFALVAQEGYRDLTVGMITARAGVSRRTFYELFSDREDCFLQAFDHALDVLAERVLAAYGSEREWTDRVRAGLAVLLECLDREPALRRLVFVEALAAGPRVLARRTQVLEELTAAVDGGRADGKAPEGVPALAAEGIVGASFGVIYGHLSQRHPEPLVGLLNQLMATIVLPYRGSAAAAEELVRRAPERVAGAAPRLSVEAGRPLGSTLPADFRLTVRTQMALQTVAKSTARGVSPSNLEVAGRIGVSGKSTVSRMMSRLQEQGLVENMRGQTKGLEKAWRLTRHGEAVLDAHRPVRVTSSEELAGISGGKLVAKRTRARSVPVRAASAGFRLTARTQLVLIAVSEHAGASNREIAGAAGVRDQGQISKLLARLADRGLIHNTAGATVGFAKAWRLTPRGEALLHAGRDQGRRAA